MVSGGFAEDGLLRDEAAAAVRKLVVQDATYAVRSSAIAEDSSEESWAGQFDSYLEVRSHDVVGLIERCHGSVGERAAAYSSTRDANGYDIAVVVQILLRPQYAGVLFTRNPVSGAGETVIEYVSGLGEKLVSGLVDPDRIVVGETTPSSIPFDVSELDILAKSVEALFGCPQDIEWALADDTLWLLQARPITVKQKLLENYALGEPDDLFFWGPIPASATYMSDFMSAIDHLFLKMRTDPTWPNPPKTLVLFVEGNMVWLSNAGDFGRFCEATFNAYLRSGQLEQDREAFNELAREVLNASDFEPSRIVQAWLTTELAEFSLYGAEAALIKQLDRFDSPVRQQIWSAFTVPDSVGYLNRIEADIVQLSDAHELAQRYPWILHGYNGLEGDPVAYFDKRIADLAGQTIALSTDVAQREQFRASFIAEHGLSDEEVQALTAARALAEWMAERKVWMMQTRHLLTESIGEYGNGWFFDGERAKALDETTSASMWNRYVAFKGSSAALSGVVASDGGQQFVHGVVTVIQNAHEAVGDGCILVTRHTAPDFVPLMRKAKALVTDHGGMMSHAAIVAREFRLPCIVATRRVTQVLRTGDEVVLDLITGQVLKQTD